MQWHSEESPRIVREIYYFLLEILVNSVHQSCKLPKYPLLVFFFIVCIN
jgi:hypothetical protein